MIFAPLGQTKDARGGVAFDTVWAMRNQAQEMEWFWPAVLICMAVYCAQTTHRAMLVLSSALYEWSFHLERIRAINTAASHHMASTVSLASLSGLGSRDMVLIGLTGIMLLVSIFNAVHMRTAER